MKFDDLKFNPHIISPEDGVQALHFFDNGYGVSVVKFPGSYGYTEGLYEVGVLKGNETDFEICYDTHVTDGIVGHCDEIDVETMMEDISRL